MAAIQVGSTAKGYDDESSDVDLEVVVTEEKYVDIEKNFRKFVHSVPTTLESSGTRPSDCCKKKTTAG